MSIRVTALYIFVTFLCIYAWKDWFKSLCGLILLMAIIEHEDMPKTILGIQGLNLWNVLFVVVFLVWLASRRREGLTWDMPRYISILLLMFVGVIVVSVIRAAFDRSNIEDYSLSSLISEELMNSIKWVLPGIILFDGCRSRKQVIIVLICLLTMYFLITVQVVIRLPPQAILSGDAIFQARKSCKDIGYGACDMSTMLAGVSWGIIAALPLVRQKKFKALVLATAGIVVFGQALTGGRAGYIAWGCTGLVLCLLKWRKYLILAPVVVMLLPVLLPGAVERMLTGYDQTDVAGESMIDDYEVTSGRTEIWPHVIDKIFKSPAVGYGRQAMVRTGLQEYLRKEYGDSSAVAHPHNMYLEILLDNGILGSIPIWLLFALIVRYSGILFRRENHLCSAVGGLALSLTLAQLVAGLGSQHFYPEPSTMGMWVAVFLGLRVYIEDKSTQMGAITAKHSWSGRLPQQIAVDFTGANGILSKSELAYN